MTGFSRAPAKKKSRPTPKTSAMRSSVGSVGNNRPRSIFDSSAGESPVCRPSSTRPSFFFRRSDRTLPPMP
jgi:hypothetical protein